eukprot:scaffold10910_cov277-Chaetoceros_neogracile.AAC.1
MQKDLIQYLWCSGFGPLVFLKASGCLIWGFADVLNVSFSNVENEEAESSRRMGILYSSVGVGCLIGPLLANTTIVDGRKPSTLQLAILFGLAMATMGWLGVASNTSSFKLICIFTMVRATGSALNLASTEILGRVLGLEHCVARLAESFIAYTAGRLQDGGHSKSEMSFIAAGIGSGAAQRKYDTDNEGVGIDTAYHRIEYIHDPAEVMT